MINKELNISVYHLDFISNLIIASFEALERFSSIEIEETNENRMMQLVLFENIVTNILIRTSALYDEYHRQFLKIDDIKVANLKYNAEPIWERINQWSEIRSFRNNVLAHNIRSKEKNFESVFLIRSFADYNIPKRVLEVKLLVQCVDFFKQLLHGQFEDEYFFVKEHISLINKKNEIFEDVDYDKEVAKLSSKLHERLNN